MSNQISTQATKFWQLVSAPSTANTYQQTIAVTGQLLKEAALLVWLVLCLGLVFFDWVGTTAVTLGGQLRNWVNALGQTSSDQVATNTGKALLSVGKTGIASTIALARNQLGLPEKSTEVTLESTQPPTTAPTSTTLTKLEEPTLGTSYMPPRSTPFNADENR